MEQPLYNAHVQDWVTVLSLSLVQEFGTTSQPHSDKLFPPLLSKDNWRLTFLAVRFRVNIRLHKDFIYMHFIVVMRSRPLFLRMLRTTNPSFDLIWFDLADGGPGARCPSPRSADKPRCQPFSPRHWFPIWHSKVQNSVEAWTAGNFFIVPIPYHH